MFSNIKNILSVAAIAAIIALSGYAYILKGVSEKNKADALRHESNSEFYQGQLSAEASKNIALRLTVEELENSKDSVLVEMNKLKKKKGGIGKSKPGDILIGSTGSIDVEGEIKIPNTAKFKLDTVIIFNRMTKSYIKIDSTSVKNRLDIDFGIFFNIGSRLAYKNERKNWFDRLMHLDYKKKAVIKYEYEFTNEAIKPSDIRVVVVEE